MKISTDKRILQAAKKCSDEYQREAHAEGIDTTASWKEVAFFVKGADWMKETACKSFCRTECPHLMDYCWQDETDIPCWPFKQFKKILEEAEE